VDDLEEQAHLGPSLGHESHKLDTIAHTPDDDDRLWRLEIHLRGPILSLHHPNNLPWRLQHYILGLDALLGLGFGGGGVDVDT
jgi:hypothetical protein